MIQVGPNEFLAGFFGGFFALVVVSIIVAIALYVYTSFALMRIAQRMKEENAWLAWIPIVNLYLVWKMSKTPVWSWVLVLLAFIPSIGVVASLAVTIWWWWMIAERVKFPGWMGILMAIPVVNLITLGILAWSKA